MTHIRTENVSYPACTLPRGGRQCNKKLVEQARALHDKYLSV